MTCTYGCFRGDEKMETERIFVYEADTQDLIELPPHYSGLTDTEIGLLLNKSRSLPTL